MTVAQVPQEESSDRFHPPESPPLAASNLRLGDGQIEKWLKQWGEKGLFGGPYLKEYLDDRKRRNCRPATLRGYFSTLTVFLSYLKARGRTSLDTITREDLGSFIEHEQDRGRQPNTVSTRLRLLYAFLGYLADREVVHPEVLKRKLRVKVPEALPRAMDPEDVQELLAVIKRCRDRALILVLLRTGMRIGELLATRMSEVRLQDRQIIIMEAQKTRVGRVAYLSADACEALTAWVQQRGPAKERLFYGQGRLSLGYTAVRMRFAKYLDEAGLAHKGYTALPQAHLRHRAVKRRHAPGVPAAAPRAPQYRDDPALCPADGQHPPGGVLPGHGDHRKGGTLWPLPPPS